LLDRAPGVLVRILTDGDSITLVLVEMEPGSAVPTHTHENEQTGTLLSGRLAFDIGDETYEFGPGDAWMIPANVPHEARAIQGCEIVECFSPPRADWR
jgi:quercetin dioxygenase-like cupin family protein